MKLLELIPISSWDTADPESCVPLMGAWGALPAEACTGDLRGVLRKTRCESVSFGCSPTEMEKWNCLRESQNR